MGRKEDRKEKTEERMVTWNSWQTLATIGLASKGISINVQEKEADAETVEEITQLRGNCKLNKVHMCSMLLTPCAATPYFVRDKPF